MLWEPGNENPAAGERASGAQESCNGRDHTTAARRSAKPFLRVSWGEGDAAITATFTGRKAQTLALLLAVGPLGFTSDDASLLGWARRTSQYVHKLRAAGLDIATTWETVADGARVGRYSLGSKVQVVIDSKGGPAAA